MRHPLACLLLGLTLTAGCGTGGALQPEELSAIRVYNAAPDSPALNIYLRSAPIASSLAYGFGRFYKFVPAGGGVIEVQNNVGDVLLDYPATLAGGTAYTFAVTGTVASPKPVLLVDDTTAAPAGTFTGTITSFNSGRSVSAFLIGNSGPGGGGAPYSVQLVADHS